jgi:hypothetical protein
MRTCDLDTSGRVWVYTPWRHKTKHHEKGRVIPIGPRAQVVLKPWLKTDMTAYLFSPADARAERFAGMRAQRKSKVPPSPRNRGKPGAKRRPGKRYTTHTYYVAIQRRCARAFPHPTISKIKHKKPTAEQLAELSAWDRDRSRLASQPTKAQHGNPTPERIQLGHRPCRSGAFQGRDDRNLRRTGSGSGHQRDRAGGLIPKAWRDNGERLTDRTPPTPAPPAPACVYVRRKSSAQRGAVGRYHRVGPTAFQKQWSGKGLETREFLT